MQNNNIKVITNSQANKSKAFYFDEELNNCLNYLTLLPTIKRQSYPI